MTAGLHQYHDAEDGTQDGAHQHADFHFIHPMRGPRECQGANEQAHGEADTAQDRDVPDLQPARALRPGGEAQWSASTIGDKSLCETVNTAGKTMKTGITESQQTEGGVLAADAKRHFQKFSTAVSKALVSAEAGEVTSAAKALADEIGRAAKDADPIGTAAASNFEQLSSDITAACKSAGVTVDF